jgi:uncharacterized protein (DUF983 family)
MEALDIARHCIRIGDQNGAKRALFRVLNADPYNVRAWRLLATVLDDPERQAHCYRRVVALDPGDHEAAQALHQLTGETPFTDERPPTGETKKPSPLRSKRKPLRCPQCGGAMVVRFVGRMRDKRAACQFCASEVDLPDAYQRVDRQRQQEHRPWGIREIDRTLVETRSDHPNGLPTGVIPETLDELLQLVDAYGGEITVTSGDKSPGKVLSLQEFTHWLNEQGFSITEEDLRRRLVVSDAGPVESRVTIRRTVERRHAGFSPPRAKPIGLLGSILRQLGGAAPTISFLDGLWTSSSNFDELNQKAGQPIPPSRRARCPRCGATIAKSTPRCTWCGLWFE